MRILLVLSLLGVATPAFAQFEGMLEMTMSGAASGTTQVHVSKAGVRTDTSMALQGMNISHSTLVLFKEPHKIFTIDDKQQTYTVLERDPDKEKERQAKKKAPITVKKLGKDTVSGFKCEHLLVSTEGHEMELWTTRDLPGFEAMAHMFDRSMNDSSGFYAALKKENAEGFIAKMKSNDPQHPMTMELTKVTKGAQPASLFEIPSTYTKKEAGAGMGMGGGNLPPEVRKRMEEQMKNMTPEQREQMMKAMQQRQGQGQ